MVTNKTRTGIDLKRITDKIRWNKIIAEHCFLNYDSFFLQMKICHFILVSYLVILDHGNISSKVGWFMNVASWILEWGIYGKLIWLSPCPDDSILWFYFKLFIFAFWTNTTFNLRGLKSDKEQIQEDVGNQVNKCLLTNVK